MSTENVNWDRLRGSREAKSFKGDAKVFHAGMESSAVKGFVEVKDWWDSECCCLVWYYCKTYRSFCITRGKKETPQSVRNFIKSSQISLLSFTRIYSLITKPGFIKMS